MIKIEQHKRTLVKNGIKRSKRKSLESKLKVIAETIGSYVVFKIGVDKKGNIGILEVENDFEDDEEDESPDEKIDYPTIVPKINIKKPLTFLEYIG